MKLDAIEDYVGNDKPQRGASTKTDRFIVKAPKPFGVVYKKNPKHNPDTEEGKMKPARLFVRWESEKPKGEAPVAQAPPAPSGGKPLPKNGEQLLAGLQTYDDFLVRNNLCKPGELLAHVRAVFVKHGENISKWAGSVIAEAVAEAKQFDVDCRAAAASKKEVADAGPDRRIASANNVRSIASMFAAASSMDSIAASDREVQRRKAELIDDDLKKLAAARQQAVHRIEQAEADRQAEATAAEAFPREEIPF